MTAWGHADLTKLIADARAGHSLDYCAIRQSGSVTSADCDRALWAKLGRSIDEALNVLNGGHRPAGISAAGGGVG